MAVVIGAGFAFALGAFCAKIVADALDRHAWVALLVAMLAVAGAARSSGRSPSRPRSSAARRRRWRP